MMNRWFRRVTWRGNRTLGLQTRVEEEGEATAAEADAAATEAAMKPDFFIMKKKKKKKEERIRECFEGK